MFFINLSNEELHILIVTTFILIIGLKIFTKLLLDTLPNKKGDDK